MITEVNKMKKNAGEKAGVRQANFYVLRGARMPAVLIEAGYMTNPGDAKKLRSRRFRERVAKTIFDSILEYKKKQESEFTKK